MTTSPISSTRLDIPKLNPLDYYVWGVVEMEINEQPHIIKDSLKAVIVNVTANINQNHLIKDSRRVQGRTETVIAANGSIGEWTLRACIGRPIYHIWWKCIRAWRS